MEIILKNKLMKDELNASFLFGLKDLSTYDNVLSLEELESLDTSKIYIAIDKNIFNEDLLFLEKALVKLNELKVKGILFYDLAILSLSKKLNINLPLIWNQNFLVTNYKTCMYYQKDGVSGAVLSSEITIDEIKEIAENIDFDLFVNIFGYQLMGASKRNLVSNYFEYIDEENLNKFNYMIEKDNKYPILENKIGTKIFTKDVLCGIRYLNNLKEAGIKHIILSDDLLDDNIFYRVYEIFKNALDKELSNQELLELEKEINSIIPTSLGFFNKETIYKVKRND